MDELVDCTSLDPRKVCSLRFIILVRVIPYQGKVMLNKLYEVTLGQKLLATHYENTMHFGLMTFQSEFYPSADPVSYTHLTLPTIYSV